MSLVAALSLANCAAPLPYGPARVPFAPAVSPQNSAARLLAVHNRERAAVGAPPLVWDSAMAESARIYALELTRIGRLRHSDRRARPGQGENLWMGTAGGYSIEQMAGGWAAEKAYFRPGIFPNVSRTGNWAAVGHYTQMIWRTTQRLGCGLARGRGSDVLVCRYSPAGNIAGRRVP